MTMLERRFIVFEGLDGAGTTTQTGMLHDYLTRQGLDSFQTFEPTDGSVGRLIRELLTGAGDHGHPPELAMALLFAADRIAHSGRIGEALAGGSHVVCDRYIFSSMAYQSLDSSIPGERVIELNRGCARPDITIFIDVPVDTCLERISARNNSRTIYERADLLQTISKNYGSLRGLYETTFGKTVTVDGTLSPADVHHDVIEAVTSLLA